MLEVLHRHLVVVCLDVAQLSTALAHSCQCRLHLHHLIHLLLGSSLLIAEEAEHPIDMRAVGIADAGGNGVPVKVILLLSQGDAALRDIEDVVLAVFLVSAKAEAHELLVTILQQSLLHGKEIILRGSLLQFLQQGLHRSDALTVAAFLIHGEFVEVTQFLLHGAILRFLLSRSEILQDLVDPFVVVLLQLVEATEA